MKSSVSIHSLMEDAFGVGAKKSGTNHGHRGFLLCFLSGSFIVSGFTCRSMTHFEIIFVFGAKYGLQFIF